MAHIQPWEEVDVLQQIAGRPPGTSGGSTDREAAVRVSYSKVKRSNGMIAINAHYDGKVIVPDELVDLPPNQALIVRIETKSLDEPPGRESALAWLAANASDSTDDATSRTVH